VLVCVRGVPKTASSINTTNSHDIKIVKQTNHAERLTGEENVQIARL